MKILGALWIVISLVKTLHSRNFCGKSVRRENFCNFLIVRKISLANFSNSFLTNISWKQQCCKWTDFTEKISVMRENFTWNSLPYHAKHFSSNQFTVKVFTTSKKVDFTKFLLKTLERNLSWLIAIHTSTIWCATS